MGLSLRSTYKWINWGDYSGTCVFWDQPTVYWFSRSVYIIKNHNCVDYAGVLISSVLINRFHCTVAAIWAFVKQHAMLTRYFVTTVQLVLKWFLQWNATNPLACSPKCIEHGINVIIIAQLHACKHARWERKKSATYCLVIKRLATCMSLA